MTSIYTTINDISREGRSIKERIGDPEPTYAALGYIVVGFSWLELSVKKMILLVANDNGCDIKMLTSEMSYKSLVGCLSSMVKARIKDGHMFNSGNESQEEMWNDIVRMLFSCEEIRNKLLHSNWITHKANVLIAHKVSAKAKNGITESSTEYTDAKLFDIYDYFLCVSYELEEYFLDVHQNCQA